MQRDVETSPYRPEFQDGWSPGIIEFEEPTSYIRTDPVVPRPIQIDDPEPFTYSKRESTSRKDSSQNSVPLVDNERQPEWDNAPRDR